MDFENELKVRLAVIRDWLDANKLGATTEKRETIVWDMFRCVVTHSIESDIPIIRERLQQKPFTIVEGNLWEDLHKYFNGNTKYVAFFKDIRKMTPCGINSSPNACCGKFELMYRLLRPDSTQPTKGDIMDNGEKYELKGCDARIMDKKLTGEQYRKNCAKLFEEHHIAPNNVKTGGLKGKSAYEIEKKQHKEHYQKEFGKDVTKSRQLICACFTENGWECSDMEIGRIFESGAWSQEIMNRVIVEKMFIKYKQEIGFDKMYLLGDGTNVKVICELTDLDKIQIGDDYFRINQPLPVGFYVS
jgi:hypothetical protein